MPATPGAPGAAPVRQESDWARDHPQPQVTQQGDLLILWNYPVGDARLAPAHADAVARFVEIARVLDPGGTRCEVGVCGHASASGEQAANEVLSQRRAQAVEAFLRRLGVQGLTVTWVGASSPLDPAPSGLGLARNRRVEVHRFTHSVGRRPVPLEPGPPGAPAPTPSGTAPPATPDLMAAFEQSFEARLATVRLASLVADVKLAGKLKVQVRGRAGRVGGKAVLKDGRLSAEAQARIGEHIRATLGLEEREGGLPRIRFGAQADKAALKPKVGLQTDSKFVFVSFDLVQQALPDVQIGDVTLSLDFTGQVKFDIGPSEAAAARLARFAAPAAGGALPAAAAVGVIGAATVINGGTALLAQQAREQGLRHAAQLAWRDGAASRVALEIVGSDAQALHAQRQLDWRKLEGGPSAAFDAGAAAVVARLRPLDKAGREALRRRWDDRYAKGLGLAQWPDIRENVFLALGGYETDAETLPTLAAL